MTQAPETAPMPGPQRRRRKIRFGVVTSNRMQKTIVVQVTRRVRHPKYSRVIPQRTSFKVHDEENRAAVGDWVRIMETRPLSKDKRWRLIAITRRASSAPAVPGAEPEPARAPAERARPSQETQGAASP